MRRIAIVAGAVAMLAACDTWMGGEDSGPPLEGDRLSVLSHETRLKPDIDPADLQIRLPRPSHNTSWPQAGGWANHAMHHLAAGQEGLSRAWTVDIGAGSDDRNKLLSSPVASTDAVFAIDSEAQVSAYTLADGDELWSVSLMPENEDGEALMGGGIAFEDGRLFVTTGFGEVVALDAGSGQRLWSRSVTAPVRAAPTVRGGRVFVVSVDNKLHALAADNGRLLWSQSGVSEASSLLGQASPAVDAGVVVAAFSSGELMALRVSNGGSVWTDALTSQSRTDAIADIADIPARPVIDRGRIYAVGHGGLMVAIDMRTGMRLWETEVGGLQQPWVAGGFVYVMTSDAELVCIDGRSGRILWVAGLPMWDDPDLRELRLIWHGPILVSDRLIVVGSNGVAYSVSPYTGKILGAEEMPDSLSVAPIVVGGTVVFLTDGADLIAYR